jgi:hypothetical protein
MGQIRRCNLLLAWTGSLRLLLHAWLGCTLCNRSNSTATSRSPHYLTTPSKCLLLRQIRIDICVLMTWVQVFVAPRVRLSRCASMSEGGVRHLMASMGTATTCFEALRPEIHCSAGSRVRSSITVRHTGKDAVIWEPDRAAAEGGGLLVAIARGRGWEEVTHYRLMQAVRALSNLRGLRLELSHMGWSADACRRFT